MNTYIDIERYPIEDFASAKRDDLVANCQKQLEETNACVLPGFVCQNMVTEMAMEISELTPLGYYVQRFFNTYSSVSEDTLPASHPCRKVFPSVRNVLAYDLIPKEAKIHQLYQWDILTTFLSNILGKKIYRFADPFQSLNIIEMKDGDQLAWHYDLSDFVVTILLQAPEAGGEFEFVPMIRSLENENFDQVEQLFAGYHKNTRLMAQAPGTLVLFQGLNSLHRVRTVYGKKPRLTAVLSYDKKENFTSTDEANIYLYGPRVTKKLQGL